MNATVRIVYVHTVCENAHSVSLKLISIHVEEKSLLKQIIELTENSCSTYAIDYSLSFIIIDLTFH